jgi:hypothetical protein
LSNDFEIIFSTACFSDSPSFLAFSISRSIFDLTKQNGFSISLNLKPGDPGFAASSSSGNTTEKATVYEYPGNPKITLHDLPGFGSIEFPTNEYGKTMKLYEYVYANFTDSFLQLSRSSIKSFNTASVSFLSMLSSNSSTADFWFSPLNPI